MNFMQHIAEHAISKLIHVLTTWSTHVKSWTDTNKDIPTIIIKYENMLESPEREFRKILKALGFSIIDEEKFKFALEQTKFENLQQLEKDNTFREKGSGEEFFRVGKSNQWREKLTKKQIKQIEKDHGEYMKRYGYKLAYSPC
jgi:hypothetical protein